MNKLAFKLILVVVLCGIFSVPAIASIEIDKLKYELVQSLKQENYSNALRLIKNLRAKKIPLGTEIIYFEAKSNLMTGQPREGERLLRKYVKVAKGKGANYQRAIGMIIEIDNIKAGKAKAVRVAKANKIAKQKVIAAERKRVFGKIVSINKDWGYAVIEVSKGMTPAGKKVFSRLNENETIEFKVGNAKGERKYSATPADIARVKVGDVLYFD